MCAPPITTTRMARVVQLTPSSDAGMITNGMEVFGYLRLSPAAAQVTIELGELIGRFTATPLFICI